MRSRRRSRRVGEVQRTSSARRSRPKDKYVTKMPRKYDEFGYNRQFKSNPCNRRDPFPRDHLPFVDDMSVLSEMHGNGLGGYGPKMPQPITSKPVQHMPSTPSTIAYEPKTPNSASYTFAYNAATDISSNIKGAESPQQVMSRVEEIMGVLLGAEGGSATGAGYGETMGPYGAAAGAAAGFLWGGYETYKEIEAMNKAISETRIEKTNKYREQPFNRLRERPGNYSMLDPFGSP